MIGVGTMLAESYRIEAELGREGMSVVHRGTHLSLATHVAIKVLHAHNPQFRLEDPFAQ